MRALLLASALLAPSLAWADPYVPAITSTATATSMVATGAPGASNNRVAIPAGMPPKLGALSPSAPLNAKEKTSAALAATWRNHPDKPVRGADGVLLWPFGTSLPSVVCAPLQICDVALQPGEVVNEVRVGDAVRWLITPLVSRVGTDRVTHLVVKATDAGLVSSVIVYTNIRIYSIKLISTQTQWTPLTAFSYPEAPEDAWQKYGAEMATTAATSAVASGDLNLDYTISGDAPWRPTHVYSQGGKTIIILPETVKYGTAPALIGLAGDGGWFSSPSEQMLRYRVSGTKITIDGLPDHFKLVTGVGSGQTRVDVRRAK